MAKNDYRRALIMLRGMEKGCLGHARLETRVMSGTLTCTVSTPWPDAALCAAFIGRRGGRLTGLRLGRLRDDGRGQQGLMATFDPRNIAGMELSAVVAVVIARLSGSEVQPLLYGWINGSAELNWDEARALLKTLCAEEAPPLPEAAPPAPAEATAPPESAPAENPQPEETSEEAALPPAADGLGLDMRMPWPPEAEELRPLFETRPRFEPFDMPDFVFVRAEMAAETHIDSCAVGVRAEEGRITGICYAIPMPWSAQPPAGLEGSVWMGDSNSGWWVTVRDLPLQS